MVRPAPTSLSPISDLASFSFVMIFLVFLAFVGRLLTFTEFPEMQSGPIVASPKVPATPFNREIHGLFVGRDKPIPFVTVDRRGRIFVNHKIVAADRLRDELVDSQQRGESQHFLYLDADKSLPFGKILGILRAARTLGVERFGLVVAY